MSAGELEKRQLRARPVSEVYFAAPGQIGVTETTRRRVNDELKRLAERFRLDDRPLLLICECGYAECESRLRVPAEDYERVRSQAGTVLVDPGHEVDRVDRILSRHDGFNVVVKGAALPAASHHGDELVS